MLSEEQIPGAIPGVPGSMDDIDLSEAFLQDLTIKTIYTEVKMLGKQIAASLGLPFGNIVKPLLDKLQQIQYIDIQGGAQFADEWEYTITDAGRKRVREILEENKYIGPAPVSLKEYDDLTSNFTISDEQIDEADLKDAFHDLVISPDVLDTLGPAVNSGKSVFVFGKPGNGKTVMCEKIIDAFSGLVAIPHAILIGGTVIKFFDPLYHEYLEIPDKTIDERWMVTPRPFVSVGGELSMEELDLIYNPEVGFYEAPFQLKANTGILLVDDFGRQSMDPKELLNRWIVPLEKRRDFLTLHTGLKADVPFEVLIFYSTNINPDELVDEAFLRRLRYKIHASDPDEDEYRDIFRLECKKHKVSYEEEMVEYLLEKHYRKGERSLRRCHPRDLIEMIVDYCRYYHQQPELKKELLDKISDAYFPDKVITSL